MNLVEKYEKYAKLVGKIEVCDKCFDGMDKRILLGKGDINPDILFIGHAPNENYEGKGTVFGPYSPSGKIFNKILESIKVNGKNNKKTGFTYWVTNCVNCSCPLCYEGKGLRGEIEQCKKYFEEELEILKPKILVFFGKESVEHITGTTFEHTKIFKWNSYVCIQSYHPAVRAANFHWDDKAIRNLGDKISSLL